ncbi:MAG: hypothetical protein JWL86_6134 [Rhizobium sp.]|nr:hypothetical protein [Rhizobium sp.]
MLTPVMLQSQARSGTTVFMLILSCAKDIYFSHEYPFEERDLNYMVRLVNLATRPIERKLRNELLKPNMDALRGYPYVGAGDFFDNSDAAKRNLFLTLWRGYSTNARKNGSYRYYAEKVVADVAEQVDTFIGTKSIFLMRDPRAVFNSILQFDEKRGYYAFGRQEGEPVTEYAARFCSWQKAPMQQFAALEPGDSRLKLRYEDLMQGLAAAVGNIEAFLDTTIDRSKLKRDFGAFIGRHATSDSASSSVSGWREKLPADVASLITERMGEELALLDYA